MSKTKDAFAEYIKQFAHLDRFSFEAAIKSNEFNIINELYDLSQKQFDKIVEIDDNDIDRIKEAGIKRFHETAEYGMQDKETTRVLLLIAGLEEFIYNKGLIPNFRVKFRK